MDAAEAFYKTHNAGFTPYPFPRELFAKFIRENDGYFPVTIEALPEVRPRCAFLTTLSWDAILIICFYLCRELWRTRTRLASSSLPRMNTVGFARISRHYSPWYVANIQIMTSNTEGDRVPQRVTPFCNPLFF